MSGLRISVDTRSEAAHPDRKCCLNCRYFDMDFIESDEDRESLCFRYPPTYIGPDYFELEEMCEASSNTDLWSHPWVGIGGWCGEWAAREDEE